MISNSKLRKMNFIVIFLIYCIFTWAPSVFANNLQISKVHKVFINSTINPATYHYLSEVTDRIMKNGENNSLLLIEMDTPGGLVTTTKDILTLFGKSSLPVVVWVHPEGGSATSAGALIAAGSHLLFMSEGTNIGAATPIGINGDLKKGRDVEGKNEESSDLRAKAINDLVALVTSLSDLRGRNGAKFSEMITKAASFTATEAHKENIIDGLANNQKELLKALNGRTVKIQGDAFVLEVSPQVQVIDSPMDLGEELLNILAHPSLAYVFFLIGAALIYLELQAPGGFIAGSVGAVCLILAGIGLQVLPLNFGALGLILLSFVLFILEVFITSFGLLSIAGLCSLIFGSLFLFRTEDSYLSFSSSLVFASVAAIGGFLGLCLFIILKDRKKVGHESFNEAVGKEAKVIKELPTSSGHFLYQVKVGGEIWKGESPTALERESFVKVIGKSDDDMILLLEALEK